MTQNNTQPNPILTAFAEALRARDRSAATVKHYLSDLRQFVRWFETRTGEPFTLEGVTEYDVRDWRDHLAATLKPASVNRKLAALSALYRWAGETGQVERDPTRYVNGVAQQPTAPKALSDQELTRILRKVHQAGNKRDIALLELLAATGLRASEVAGLTVGDLELNERSGWVTVRGKGRKQRRVPVNAKARRALREYLEERGHPPAGSEPAGGLSLRGGAARSWGPHCLSLDHGYNLALAARRDGQTTLSNVDRGARSWPMSLPMTALCVVHARLSARSAASPRARRNT